MRLAAIVVWYNPEDIVYENMMSYLKDVEKIYVYDNSTRKNKPLVAKIIGEARCSYEDGGGNRGLSYALTRGCREAEKEGYEFILTMDQDSFFEEGAVKQLKEAYLTEYRDYAMIAPNCKSLGTDGEVLYVRDAVGEGVQDVFWVMTSGSIMRLDHFFEGGGTMKACLSVGWILISELSCIK